MIRISRLFYESKLLGIEDISDLNVWGKIHGILGGLELKIKEEKLKNPSDRPWGAAPTGGPRERL